MASFVAVMPYRWQPYMERCVATMSPRWRDSLLLVDNTVDNIGIMAAHNIGYRKAIAADADWLVIVSAAIRFGLPGGDDFLHALDTWPNHRVIEAAGVNGWHLIAFRRDVLEAVGGWDENFTPYGFDDIDYSIRFQLAYGQNGMSQMWEKVVIKVTDMGMAHSVHLAGLVSDANPKIDYFMRKWGRHPGASTVPYFPHPFNDPSKGLDYWPEPRR